MSLDQASSQLSSQQSCQPPYIVSFHERNAAHIAHYIAVIVSHRQASRVGSKMLSMGVQVEKLVVSTQDADAVDGDVASDSQVSTPSLSSTSECLWCLFQVDTHTITWELLPVHYRL